MTIQDIKKINFRQPKYMLPAILYLPILATTYFVVGMFTTDTAEIPGQKMEKTEYLNSKLPDANVRGDGMGGRFDNMKNSYGMIEDATAVNIIDRNEEDQREGYESKYSEEELARLNDEAQKHAQANNSSQSEIAGLSKKEEEALAELNKALAEARMKGSLSVEGRVKSEESDSKEPSVDEHSTKQPNHETTKQLREEDSEQEVVKKVKVASDYFNTLAVNEKEPNMIKAIIDENIKAVDGSRVRLRLLDDVEIGEMVVRKGSYMYAIMSGFGNQRVKGNVKSVMVSDEIIKINLALYDTDGLEGLYVPSSHFRETSKDVASGAMNGNMNMGTTTGGNSLQQWGMQAAQNAYQKTSNAISKTIRKNSVKLKYGTFVYLINSKEIKQQK